MVFRADHGPENNGYGRLWVLPWDTDSTWGPTFNCGEDRPYDAIFPSCDGRGDAGGHPEMQREYRNTIREVRDLLFNTEQVNGIIDSIASDISPLIAADRTRWNTVPGTAKHDDPQRRRQLCRNGQ